jgi:tetratricopeptide (TPR) repeat protein
MVGLARALWRHGQTARGHELTLEAIPILERRPGPELLLAYERAAGEDAMGGRPQEALSWAERGIALADELGVENIVRHLQFRGMARIELGDAEGLADMRHALDLALRLGLGIETGTSYMNLGELITGFEGVTAGLELVDASLEFARRCGLTHHVMWSRTSRLYYLYELGLWDELLREADEVARWDRGQGGGSQIEVWTLIASAPVRAQRGSPDEARRDAVTFLPRAREVADPQMLIPALAHAGLVFAASGELDEAVALAQEFERTFVRAMRGFNYPVLPTILRICVAAGELTLAQSLVDVTAEVAASPLLLHSTTAGSAILADAHGERERAATLYREAAEGWAEWGSVVERAYALLGLGRCGDEDAAREAAAIFERLGARPVLARAA